MSQHYDSIWRFSDRRSCLTFSAVFLSFISCFSFELDCSTPFQSTTFARQRCRAWCYSSRTIHPLSHHVGVDVILIKRPFAVMFWSSFLVVPVLLFRITASSYTAEIISSKLRRAELGSERLANLTNSWEQYTTHCQFNRRQRDLQCVTISLWFRYTT